MLASGRVSEAEKLLLGAIRAEPDSAALHAQLGMLYYQVRRYPQAIESLGRAVQLEEANPEYTLSLADVLLASRRFSVAAEFLNAVKARFDNLPAYQYDLGLAYYGLRNFAIALGHFRQALQLAPKLDLARYFEGNCLAAIGDLQGAQQAYRTALKVSPAKPDYLFALGKTLSLSGPEHDAETISLLEKALAIQPEHSPSKLYLALAFERANRLTEARNLLEALAQKHPDQMESYVALTRIYYRLKQHEKGDEASRIAKKLRDAQQQVGSTPTP